MPLNVAHECNLAAAPEKAKRKAALGRLCESTADEAAVKAMPVVEQQSVYRTAVRALEDATDRCRELAVSILLQVAPHAGADVLDWIVPAVGTRIGLQPVAEEDEEIRLRLLQLLMLCLSAYPAEVGRRYIDGYLVTLENCIADAYPELKKTACRGCIQLCRSEPKRVKPLTVPLARAVKRACLQHKHAAVRKEAVQAFTALLSHGAAELLGDMKDEQENRTTVYFLFVLCHDSSEQVRLAALDAIAAFLLDITDRNEQPRRLLPHVLGALSDRNGEVRRKAWDLLEAVGRQFLVDNEDNRIDIDQRRVTMKDIEWYADDDGPHMDLSQPTATTTALGLDRRPSLGARYAVAEHIRHFLDSTLSHVNTVTWMIPFSNSNRRTVALRTVIAGIWFCEGNTVQYVQQILHAMYKAVRDEDPEIGCDAAAAVEVLGKYLAPSQYLHFLLAKPKTSEGVLPHDGEAAATADREVTTTHHKVVTVVSADNADRPDALPTLFSTAAVSTKAGILKCFRLLLLGVKQRATDEDAPRAASDEDSSASAAIPRPHKPGRPLTAAEAKSLVVAITSKDLIDAPDNAALLLALLECYATVAELLVERQFVSVGAAGPLPPDGTRTLDSMLLYGALCVLTCLDPAVQHKAREVVGRMGAVIRGSPASLYDAHFGRIMLAHRGAIPPEAFVALLEGATDLAPHAQLLGELFVARLQSVDFTLRVQGEVAVFATLRRLLADGTVRFGPEASETLLRRVVLEHAKFVTAPAALPFRKVAVDCLGLLLAEPHVASLRGILGRADGTGGEACTGALVEKIVGVWLGATDSDNAEMRLSAVTRLPHICALPVSLGAASEVLQHLQARFDDSSDRIRAVAFAALRRTLYGGAPAAADGPDAASINIDGVAPAFEQAVRERLRPLCTKLLVHLDDVAAPEALRQDIVALLKRLCGISCDAVHALTAAARERHQNRAYCDEILAFTPN